MAGETTTSVANAIFSGVNKGLQGRRALKEQEYARALLQQQLEADRLYQQRQLADARDYEEQIFNRNRALSLQDLADTRVYEQEREADRRKYNMGRLALSQVAGGKAGGGAGIDMLKRSRDLAALIKDVGPRMNEEGDIVPGLLKAASISELEGLLKQYVISLAREQQGSDIGGNPRLDAAADLTETYTDKKVKEKVKPEPTEKEKETPTSKTAPKTIAQPPKALKQTKRSYTPREAQLLSATERRHIMDDAMAPVVGDSYGYPPFVTDVLRRLMNVWYTERKPKTKLNFNREF